MGIALPTTVSHGFSCTGQADSLTTVPPGKPQGFPEEVAFILKSAECVRDWRGDISVPFPKVQTEGISLKGRRRLRGQGEEVGNGAVFEQAGQRSAWGSTAPPLPSKSRKSPRFQRAWPQAGWWASAGSGRAVRSLYLGAGRMQDSGSPPDVHRR